MIIKRKTLLTLIAFCLFAAPFPLTISHAKDAESAASGTTVESHLGLIGVLGVRNGKADDESFKPKILDLGIRVTHSEINMGGNRLSLLAAGINIQTDGLFSISISPASVVIPNKMYFGFDLYFPTGTSAGGGFGISGGIPLTN
jgi:hypothetical protein